MNSILVFLFSILQDRWNNYTIIYTTVVVTLQ
jgi:hypothetical protein